MIISNGGIINVQANKSGVNTLWVYSRRYIRKQLLEAMRNDQRAEGRLA